MASVTFKKLEKNYPGSYTQGKCNFKGRQCAIRLSKALAKSGFLLDDFIGTNTCRVNNILHVRGAKSLADYIWKKLGRPKIYTSPESAKKGVSGLKGIIFFKNIYDNGHGSGGHIDLWDKMGQKSKPYIGYFDKASQIWFWKIN